MNENAVAVLAWLVGLPAWTTTCWWLAGLVEAWVKRPHPVTERIVVQREPAPPLLHEWGYNPSAWRPVRSTKYIKTALWEDDWIRW